MCVGPVSLRFLKKRDYDTNRTFGLSATYHVVAVVSLSYLLGPHSTTCYMLQRHILYLYLLVSRVCMNDACVSSYARYSTDYSVQAGPTKKTFANMLHVFDIFYEWEGGTF